MTKFVTASTLTRLTVILAAGVAVMSTADIANAKHHHDNNHSGMSNNHMAVDWHSTEHHDRKNEHHDRKDKKKKDESASKKECKYVTSDGNGCGKKPVTTTQTDGNKSRNKGATTTAGNNTSGNPQSGVTAGKSSTSANAATASNGVTVSNGVTKVDLSNTPTGLMISSNSPGTITVFNGVTSQTFQGGSVTLHGAGVASGATTIQSPGLQSVKLANGDVSIAIKPMPVSAPAKPTTGNTYVPPGVTLADDAKFVGKGLLIAPYTMLTGAEVAVGSVGTTIVGAALGHPLKYTEKFTEKAFRPLEDFFDSF